jgi:hypothetical protein
MATYFDADGRLCSPDGTVRISIAEYDENDRMIWWTVGMVEPKDSPPTTT